MADKTNITSRIEKAEQLKESLQVKFEKVKGTPREEEFKLQIEKHCYRICDSAFYLSELPLVGYKKGRLIE